MSQNVSVRRSMFSRLLLLYSYYFYHYCRVFIVSRVQNLGSESRCSCPPGFGGRQCELLTRSCDTNPCHNGATCISVSGTYHCACAAGYTGFNCDVDLDECAADPCLNGIYVDEVLRPVSTTAALRVASDSERYVALCRAT